MRLFLLGMLAITAVTHTPRSALAQSPFGSIAVSPSNPTTNDDIDVAFTPAPDQLHRCALNVTVTGNLVLVISNACPVGSQNYDHAFVGRLPAGTYEVVWGIVDNIFNEPEPTAALVVTYAPAPVPSLSVLAILLCVAVFTLVACKTLGPNYSLKRTAAGRLR